MKSLLDFDDAGAQDDEPAKGVTVGDIRSWHDEIEFLKHDNGRLQIGLAAAENVIDDLERERETLSALTPAESNTTENIEGGA